MKTNVNTASAPMWQGYVPTAIRSGSRTGFSASYWHWEEGVRETRTEAIPDMHAFSFAMDPLETEFLLDKRPVFKGMFSQGMLAIMPAGKSPWAVQRGAARKLHLYLPDALLHEAAQSESGRIASSIELTVEPVVRDGTVSYLGRQVLSVLKEAGPGSALLLDAFGLQLAVYVLKHWSDHRVAHVETRPLGAKTLHSVIAYMRENYVRDISLSELSSLSGLSPAHFCRAFARAAGQPPHRYLIELRVAKARELLETSDLPISEIAAQVGYDDPSYFARLFRRVVGMTPLTYRRESRQ